MIAGAAISRKTWRRSRAHHRGKICIAAPSAPACRMRSRLRAANHN